MVVPLNVPPINEGAQTWQAKQVIPSSVILNLSYPVPPVPLPKAKAPSAGPVETL